MDDFGVFIPSYMQSIIDRLTNRDWLITNFSASREELYNPGGYIYNIKQEKVNYILILDRNVFSYISASVTKQVPNDLYRDAIGLVLFCQFCEIDIEPNLSVYEFINYNEANIDIAIDELEIFNAINNYSKQEICDYFLGDIDCIPITRMVEVDRDVLKGNLMEYKWLTEWRSLYLLVLKLVDLYLEEIANEEKLKKIIKWMSEEYKFFHVGIIFSIYLFTSIRIKNMIKFKIKDDKQEKYLQLKNMTWDLYFMNEFIRKWQQEPKDVEYIFASTDKVIKTVLSTSIITAKSGFGYFKGKISDAEYSNLSKLVEYAKENEKRQYNSSEWSVEYRDGLINNLEARLI